MHFASKNKALSFTLPFYSGQMLIFPFFLYGTTANKNMTKKNVVSLLHFEAESHSCTFAILRQKYHRIHSHLFPQGRQRRSPRPSRGRPLGADRSRLLGHRVRKGRLPRRLHPHHRHEAVDPARPEPLLRSKKQEQQEDEIIFLRKNKEYFFKKGKKAKTEKESSRNGKVDAG